VQWQRPPAGELPPRVQSLGAAQFAGKNKKNPLVVPPHSRACWPMVMVQPNHRFVAVVAGLSSGAAQPGGCGNGRRPKSEWLWQCSPASGYSVVLG
jgi:hypothetical protein